ncbi:hypothetical protein LCGC14_2988670 [marine sediment metagenome]|uniref:Uncharacterized protein n=1 Tax=marine sediment metagenome TaxID=412755 RepID=A0A0F8ZVH9_9ZZZZ
MTNEEVIAEAMAFGMSEEAAKSFATARPKDIPLELLERGDIRISLMSWKRKKESGQE